MVPTPFRNPTRAAPLATPRVTEAARRAEAVLAQMYEYWSYEALPFLARADDDEAAPYAA